MPRNEQGSKILIGNEHFPFIQKLDLPSAHACSFSPFPLFSSDCTCSYVVSGIGSILNPQTLGKKGLVKTYLGVGVHSFS